MPTLPPPPPTDAQLASLPVFPLPRVVFFPGTALPLHVFEPRYLALVEQCLAEGSPLSVVAIRPGSEAEAPGSPPLVETAGAGSIVHHERQPDGRFGVVLRGTCRVVLKQELVTDGPFRRFRAERVDDQAVDMRTAAEALEAINGCLRVIGARVPNLAEALFRAVSATAAPSEVADRLAPVIFRNVAQRQALLECVDVNERLRRVLDRLSAIAASTANAASVN